MAFDATQAREYFAQVRQRPSMYVYAPALDWKYLTAFSYIEGWLAAADPTFDLSHSFSAWLGEPTVAWWATIADRTYPDREEAYSKIPPETDADLIDDLFDALDGFLASLQA